jgi:hypothetical protein
MLLELAISPNRIEDEPMTILKMNDKYLSDCVSPEPRRHVRYSFTSAVEVNLSESQTSIQGRTTDISREGCFVDTTTSFAVGSNVTLRLTKDNGTFEAVGEVVYSLSGMGMGIKFVSVPVEQLATLEKWIAELNGEVSPEPASPAFSEQSRAEGIDENTEYDVLSELLIELMKKGVLSNEKGKEMLQKLNYQQQTKSSLVLV